MLRALLLLNLVLVGALPVAEANQEAGEAPAMAISDVEGVADWLAQELSLTPTQKARALAILELERSTQAGARAKGLVIQNAPPVSDVRFVDADSRAPARTRRTRSATQVLRDAERRKSAKEWLANESERTKLHPKLVGLRVTALDSLLKILSVSQAKRFQELLGGQGMEWIRELAVRRLRPGKAGRSKKGQGGRNDAFAKAAKLRAQAQARAEARRRAMAAAKKRAAARRGAGRGRGGRGSGRGRGRGRGL